MNEIYVKQIDRFYSIGWSILCVTTLINSIFEDKIWGVILWVTDILNLGRKQDGFLCNNNK